MLSPADECTAAYHIIQNWQKSLDEYEQKGDYKFRPPWHTAETGTVSFRLEFFSGWKRNALLAKLYDAAEKQYVELTNKHSLFQDKPYRDWKPPVPLFSEDVKPPECPRD